MSEPIRTSFSPSGMPMIGPLAMAHMMETMQRVAAAGGIPDITFDADGIQKVIDRINDVIHVKLADAKGEASQLVLLVRPPGDYASDMFVHRGRQFGADYEAWAEQYEEGLKNYVAKLEKLKQDYLAREDNLAWGFDQGMRA